MEIAYALRSDRGEFTVSTAIKLIIAAMLFAVLMSIFHIYYVIGSVREKVNESVLAVAAANVAEFYGGARESDGFARHVDGMAFISTISTDDVVDTLARSCGATAVGSAGTIIVGDSYRLSQVATEFVNVSGAVLNFKTTLTVIVPLKIGTASFPINRTIVVRSSYDPRF